MLAKPSAINATVPGSGTAITELTRPSIKPCLQSEGFASPAL